MLSLARSVAYHVRNDIPLVLMAIGAGAVNQAVKAVAKARKRVAEEGIDLVVRPSFSTTTDTIRPGSDSKVELSRLDLHISKAAS